MQCEVAIQPLSVMKALMIGVGACGQQHLAHVGVHDDRVGRLVGRLGARQRAHLEAVLRVGHGVLVGHLGQAQRLVAHAQARGVHHHEHRLQALVRLADQGADRVLQHHLAGGVAVDAHLVFEAGAEDGVALTDGTIGRDLELGHDEERDALRAGRCVRQAGQHQVDDVGREVVLAGGDEDLGAADAVRAIRLRLGLAAQHAEIGAAMRLGQAHRAGPFPAGQLGQVGLLLILGAVGMQCLIGAVRQAGVHGPGLVGRVHHLVEALVHQHRQALAAEIRVDGERRPAAFDVLGIGFLEALGRLHLVRGPVQRAAFGVAWEVQRREHFGGELAAFFQHGVDGVGVDVCMARQELQLIDGAEYFVQQELHVAKRRVVLRHGTAPVVEKRERRSGGFSGSSRGPSWPPARRPCRA
jgi:hypothetical protein